MVQKAVAKGRPRSFDPDEVLASARDVFWRYGFAGASMDQLSAATGLHKPSLYGAFGDKRRLYLSALDRYLSDVSRDIGAALAKPKLAETLDAMVQGAIALFTRKGGSGCFMMTTAVPEAGEDPEITGIVRKSLESLDEALVQRFRAAIAAGELSAGADVEAMARVMAANHFDLSARARAGYSPSELRARADRAIALTMRLGRSPDPEPS